MYTVERYIKDTLYLTNSIVIKISDIATVINKELYLTKGIKPSEDKTEWKYYQNLAGVKHFTNNDVYINVIETNTKELLTKELLVQYQDTWNEFSKYSIMYKNVIEEYPDDIDYIKGCINPVDINTAIEADDGTILTHTTHYIEHNELSLIRVLNMELKSMLQRWYINNYRITDELYLASFIATMYSVLPSIIMKIRLDNVMTNQVHSFHLENFFRSNFDIWDLLKYFNNESVIWLYNNIKHIGKNIGTNTTIRLLIEKLLTMNNIGIGIYELNSSEPELLNSVDIFKSNYTKPDNHYLLKPLNVNYVLAADEKVDIRTLTNSQLYHDNSIETELKQDLLDNIDLYTKNKLSTGYIQTQNTKTMDVDIGTLWKMFGTDEVLITLDHWLYAAITDKYTTYVNYIDPNDSNISFNLNSKTGIYLFYYLLGILTKNEDVVINTVKYTTVVDNNATSNTLLSNLFNKEYYRPIVDKILEYVPDTLPLMYNTDAFKSYMNNIETLAGVTWILDSNINNAIISSNIKHTVNRLFLTGEYALPEATGFKTIGTILAEKAITININSTYDPLLSLKYLYNLFTGKDFSKQDLFNKKINNVMNLLDKLTSYTTQFVTTINDTEPLYIPYSTVEPIHAPKGIINITKASILTPYELNYFYVNGYGNDFREYLTTFQTLHIPKTNTCDPMVSYLYVDNLDVDNYNTTHNVAVEVLNSCLDMYSPIIDVASNNIIPKHTYSVVDGTPDSYKLIHNDTILYSDVNEDFIITTSIPNTGVEIQQSDVNMYTPNAQVTTDNNSNNPTITDIRAVDITNIKDIQENTITYSNTPNTKDSVVINNSSNTIVEII